MNYSVEVIADSVSPAEHRLTSFVTTFPRMVLSEWNTHRAFSRNSASSRAIPVYKQITQVLDDPFIPIYWGKAQSGMQAESEISVEDIARGEEEWLHRRDMAVLGAFALLGGVDTFDRYVQDALDKGWRSTAGDIAAVKERVLELRAKHGETGDYLTDEMHKQIPNRLLEPWVWHTVLTSATEWRNFFALRANPEAQPEIQRIAYMMRDAYDASTPTPLTEGEWHLPFVQAEERQDQANSLEDLIRASIGRCARVSYLTHDGRPDIAADLKLYDRLLTSGHMSPFEHSARPFTEREVALVEQIGAQVRQIAIGSDDEYVRARAEEIARNAWFSGNLQGWTQRRKMLPHEDDFSKILAASQG